MSSGRREPDGHSSLFVPVLSGSGPFEADTEKRPSIPQANGGGCHRTPAVGASSSAGLVDEICTCCPDPKTRLLLAMMEPAEVDAAVLAYGRGRERARVKTSCWLKFLQSQKLLPGFFHDHPVRHPRFHELSIAFVTGTNTDGSRPSSITSTPSVRPRA